MGDFYTKTNRYSYLFYEEKSNFRSINKDDVSNKSEVLLNYISKKYD